MSSSHPSPPQANDGTMQKPKTIIRATIWVSLCLFCMGCSPTSSDASRTKSTTRPQVLKSSNTAQATKPSGKAMVALPTKVWRGVCLAHNWQAGGTKGYGTPASEEALTHLSKQHVNWVSITPFGWMKTLHDTSVKGEHAGAMPKAGESAGRVVGVIEQAHKKNMRVMLKPHIWIGRGAWRGKILPKDSKGQVAWRAWWASYEQFILYYAKLAQKHRVAALVLGVELASALKTHPESFLTLIQKVRAIYKGKITYSANWDEAIDVRVWKALDLVSTQLYPPLSKSTSPQRHALIQALRRHLKQWSKIAKDAGKPLVITEVGYKSAPNAVIEPFGWPERLPKSMKKPDPAIQKVAYDALFTALGEVDNLQGVFVWKYFTNKGTDEEGPMGFSPRGKPAEAVLKRAFASPTP